MYSVKDDLDYSIWFSSVQLTVRNKGFIIDNFDSIKGFWEYINTPGTDEVNCFSKKVLSDTWDDRSIEKIKNIIYKNNIKITTCFDSKYPVRLKNYEDSPYVLYYKGDIERLNHLKCAAVVGSRKCTYYGNNAASYIVKELAMNKVGIISGLAKGIDSISHRVCLNQKGYTCAVLGCGLDIIYPSENRKLYDDILCSGCIISEFPPGTRPYYYNFPIRNRVISALSDAVIVIEAGTKSGSLITAGIASQQGKDVFSVPGSVFSDQSKGTNQLIKDGATIFTGIDDVFSVLQINNNTEDHKGGRKEYSDLEQKIISEITDTPHHIDEIIKIINIDIRQLYNVLFELQLKNEILCLAGNYYVKNSN